MKHVILHLLRKLSFPITLFVTLGLAWNSLSLKDPRLVFPSCLMAPFLLLFWEHPAFRRLAQERVFWMLPLSRARTARAFWTLSVLIIPGLAALLAFPFFCGEIIHASNLGQSSLPSVLRFCYSIVWGSCLSGVALFVASSRPNPEWRLRAFLWFEVLNWLIGVLSLVWIVVAWSLGPAPFGMKPVLLFLSTVSFRVADLGKLLVGLAAVILSQVALRNMLIVYNGPENAVATCATDSKTPHRRAAIIFQRQNHPLLSLCLRFPFWILTMGIALGAFLCFACILAHVLSFKVSLQFAIENRSHIAYALPVFIVVGVIYLSGHYLDKLSLFRVIRVLPASSRRFAACVATTMVAGIVAIYAAGLVIALLVGGGGVFLNGARHTLLVLCGFQLLAVAVVLTCNKRLLLMIIVTLLVIGFMIPASDFAFALFAPVGSLFSSALFTNTFGLVLILVAFFWIHHSISHSTGLYQLKSDGKSEGKGSL